MTEIEYFNKIIGDINKAVSTVEVTSEDADRKIANIYRMVIAQQLCNLVDLEREASNKNSDVNKELLSKLPDCREKFINIDNHRTVLRIIAKRIHNNMAITRLDKDLAIDVVNSYLPDDMKYHTRVEDLDNEYKTLPPELMTVEEHNEILRNLAKRVDEYLLFGDDNRSLVISSINDLLPVKERYVRKET